MDNKTSNQADERSSMHLSPLASKSQAQGVSKDEIIAKDERTRHDPASENIKKRRH